MRISFERLGLKMWVRFPLQSTNLNKQTMKDNKLIAEFMGINVITEDDIRANKTPISTSHDGYLEEDLEYQSSWDWLMPVISKCRTESKSENDYWEGIYYTLEECDIDITYPTVVEFIKRTKKST
jgi:hypothetical protein